MNVLLIVLAVVGVLIIVVGLATGPAMKRRREAAHQRAIDLVGGTTELASAGASAVITGPDGTDEKPTVGVVTLGPELLAFAPWLGGDALVVSRGDITAVEATSENLEELDKAWIELTFGEGAEASAARFRVDEPTAWLEHLQG